MSEVFKAHDTYGVPIQDIADQLLSEGLAINWMDWMKSAIDHGWTYEKIKKTIVSVNDKTYGNSWLDYQYLIPLLYLKLTDETIEQVRIQFERKK